MKKPEKKIHNVYNRDNDGWSERDCIVYNDGLDAMETYYKSREVSVEEIEEILIEVDNEYSSHSWLAKAIHDKVYGE